MGSLTESRLRRECRCNRGQTFGWLSLGNDWNDAQPNKIWEYWDHSSGNVEIEMLQVRADGIGRGSSNFFSAASNITRSNECLAAISKALM